MIFSKTQTACESTLVKFQRCMKCRATSRADLPNTALWMSCHGIRGVTVRSTISTHNQHQKGNRRTQRQYMRSISYYGKIIKWYSLCIVTKPVTTV